MREDIQHVYSSHVKKTCRISNMINAIRNWAKADIFRPSIKMVCPVPTLIFLSVPKCTDTLLKEFIELLGQGALNPMATVPLPPCVDSFVSEVTSHCRKWEVKKSDGRNGISISEAELKLQYVFITTPDSEY